MGIIGFSSNTLENLTWRTEMHSNVQQADFQCSAAFHESS